MHRTYNSSVKPSRFNYLYLSFLFPLPFSLLSQPLSMQYLLFLAIISALSLTGTANPTVPAAGAPAQSFTTAPLPGASVASDKNSSPSSLATTNNADTGCKILSLKQHKKLFPNCTEEQRPEHYKYLMEAMSMYTNEPEFDLCQPKRAAAFLGCIGQTTNSLTMFDFPKIKAKGAIRMASETWMYIFQDPPTDPTKPTPAWKHSTNMDKLLQGPFKNDVKSIDDEAGKALETPEYAYEIAARWFHHTAGLAIPSKKACGKMILSSDALPEESAFKSLNDCIISSNKASVLAARKKYIQDALEILSSTNTPHIRESAQSAGPANGGSPALTLDLTVNPLPKLSSKKQVSGTHNPSNDDSDSTSGGSPSGLGSSANVDNKKKRTSTTLGSAPSGSSNGSNLQTGLPHPVISASQQTPGSQDTVQSPSSADSSAQDLTTGNGQRKILHTLNENGMEANMVTDVSGKTIRFVVALENPQAKVYLYK